MTCVSLFLSDPLENQQSLEESAPNSPSITKQIAARADYFEEKYRVV
jgi:hypothetical protein